MFPSQLSVLPRRVFVAAAALFVVSALVISGGAQAPANLPPNVIVKVNASFAKNLESGLPLQAMELVAGSTGSATIDAFLSKYSARKIRPVYANIVRTKKQQGLTDYQIATLIRQKYSKRGSRLHAAFRPPEISRTYILELDSAAQPNVGNILQALRADSNVEFAEQDHVASVNFTPNDPYFASYGSWGQPYDDLWGIKRIGAPTAWDTTAGAGVVVAVVDTGIDYNHPDIAANVWTNLGEIANNGIDDDNNGYVDDVRGWDFIGATYTNPTQSNNPIDHFGHGTHVAGTIAAVGNNGIGLIGVAWQARVMAVKGLDDNGNGLDSTLGPAIIYAANNGADVISNSWAGSGTSQTIADAISYAYNLGAVIVAAAGNSNADARTFYPANVPQVITVAATDHNDTIAYFSNWGDKIDVAAPGVDILSLRAAGTSMGTPVDANYTRADGTSMATPHVSGLAALVLAQYSSYSNEDVRQVIRVSSTSMGTPGFDQSYGYGRINAAGAMTVVDAVEAKILSPSDGTVIQGPTAISGVARGSVFAQYKLEYGAGHTPAAWTLIQSGNAPVNNGAFGTFDPSTIPDGTYAIRLTAYDTLGNAFVDRIELQVKYLSITSPVPPLVPVTSTVFKPGALVAIVGTATGASFQDFRIDWAEGIAPTSGWNTVGVSLSGGTSPVTNGLLGTWDTSSVVQADYYTVRLSVDDSGFTSIATTIVYLEPSLLSQNWPVWLDAGTYWSSGIVPMVDGAGNKTLALASQGTTSHSEYRTFSPDGATQKTTSLTNYGDFFQPSVGDLDGVPGDESVVTDVFMLKTFYADGTFSTITPIPQVHVENSPVILEDLNNDSRLETVVLGQNINNQTALVFAYLTNGQQLNANFPVAVADLNANMTSHTFGSRLAVGDVDGDGNKEILVMEGTSASTFSPRLFHNDGTPLSWAAQTQSGWPDQMVLADLDHNGTLETIFVCGCNSRKEIHVLQPDGTERVGWPVILTNSPYTISYIAVGNLKRDGHDEIVVTNSNQLFVLKPDGTSFSAAWPYTASGYGLFGPIALADIDGDGLPEIITSEGAIAFAPNPLDSSTSASAAAVREGLPQPSTETEVATDGSTILRPRVDVSAQFSTTNQYNAPTIVVFRSDASIMRTWNMLGANGNQPFSMAKVTVGDFNKDGVTDIAATYWTIMGGGQGGWLKEGVATVLTTGTPYNPVANDWPMIYENPRNTAVYRPLL
jgi:subtilisin family serine protease